MRDVELIDAAELALDAPVSPAPARRRGWLFGLFALAVVVAGAGVLASSRASDRSARLEVLEASGSRLAQIGPDASLRWTVEGTGMRILGVAGPVVVTVAEGGGQQNYQALSLDDGDVAWRATFLPRIGSSRCLVPDPASAAGAQPADLMVCALRYNPPLLDADYSGGALRVLTASTGMVATERSTQDTLLGAVLWGTDLVGVWAHEGELEVRREDAVTGQVLWTSPLESVVPVKSSSPAVVSVAQGFVLVALPRQVFALELDGTQVFTRSVDGLQIMDPVRIAPLGKDLFATWQDRRLEVARERTQDSGGPVDVLARGVPVRMLADDKSAPDTFVVDHHGGGAVWSLDRLLRIWDLDDHPVAGLVADGVLVLEMPEGVVAFDPADGTRVWGLERAVARSTLVGTDGDAVVAATRGLEGTHLVGLDAPSGRILWEVPTAVTDAAAFVAVSGHVFALAPSSISLFADPAAAGTG